MNTKRSPKRLLAHIALFIGLIALTFFILLRGQNLSELLAVLRGVRVRWLALAAGCMCVFLLCEAVNLRGCLQLFGCRCAEGIRSSKHYGLALSLVHGSELTYGGGLSDAVYTYYHNNGIFSVRKKFGFGLHCFRKQLYHNLPCFGACVDSLCLQFFSKL